MAESGTASILRRKTGQGRDGAGMPKGPPGPARALAEAFKRAAEVELQLAVTTPDPRDRRASGAELIDGLPEHAFLAVLIGPEDGAGLLALDPTALSAVIEMRTMGRVSAQAPAPRRPTQTDAAMVADLVDRILSEFEEPLVPTEDARWAAGWRYQLFLPEPRPLPVVLDAPAYRVLDMSVLFGAAAKEGRAILALPLPGRGRRIPPEPPPAESAAAEVALEWQSALGETVASAEAALDAVLGKLRLPLGALAALAPGDRIALPLSALGRLRLTAPGGTVVAEARLGQTGGLRAVRIGAADPRAVAAPAEGSLLGAGRIGPGGMGADKPFRPAAASPQRAGAEAAAEESAHLNLSEIDSALNEPLPGLELLSGAGGPQQPPSPEGG